MPVGKAFPENPCTSVIGSVNSIFGVSTVK